jgi:hypothetical protein
MTWMSIWVQSEAELSCCGKARYHEPFAVGEARVEVSIDESHSGVWIACCCEFDCM